MSVGIQEPTVLFANLGVSALALGAFYFLVAFLVWRNVRRVRSLSPNWNTLRIFCLALLIQPLLRGVAFVCHFLIKEGQKISIDWPNVVKDILMNLLYIVPSFIFLLTYMILICIWIEIALFSRDQYLIQRPFYGKIWKIIYVTILALIMSALIVCFTLSITWENSKFVNALFYSLWIMDFAVPALAAVIYIILIIRFAGFPYYNDIWRQQNNRINRIILIWTFADIISGTMTSIWSDKRYSDYWSKNSLYFQITVFATVFVTEIAPILWVSDWSNLGFLLIAFDNWRNMFIENPTTAQQHAPLLNDDPYVKIDHISPNEVRLQLESEPNNNKISLNGDGTLEHNSLKKASPNAKCSFNGASSSAISNSSPSFVSGHSMSDRTHRIAQTHRKKSRAKKIAMLRKKMDFTNIQIDATMDLPNFSKSPYYTAHKGICSGYDICVKIFRVSNLPSPMLQGILRDLQQVVNIWDHEHLGVCYGLNISDSKQNHKHINNLDMSNDNSLNTILNPDKLEIINKWYGNGSLWDIIEVAPKDTPFAPQVILRIALQIAQFMKWLHNEYNIGHGYLKSRNVLFDDNMNVKITDVGLIALKRSMQVMLHDINFDGYWNDASYFEGNPIKPSCDVWAYGFILFELISKRVPFGKSSFDEMKKKIIKHELPQIPNHCPVYIRKIIEKCWVKDRSRRTTFNDIVLDLQQHL